MSRDVTARGEGSHQDNGGRIISLKESDSGADIYAWPGLRLQGRILISANEVWRAPKFPLETGLEAGLLPLQPRGASLSVLPAPWDPGDSCKETQSSLRGRAGSHLPLDLDLMEHREYSSESSPSPKTSYSRGKCLLLGTDPPNQRGPWVPPHLGRSQIGPRLESEQRNIRVPSSGDPWC